MERHLWYHSFIKMTNNLLLSRSTVTDRVLTWCPYYSYEVQTCIISSHEKLGMKISSWRFYLVIEKCDLRQSANASNNSNLNFGHRYKRIFKCLNQYVMTGFFLSVFRPRTDINNKTVPRCYAARHRFFKLVLYQLFHFRQESYDDFFNKNCFAYFSYFAP